MFIKTSMSYFLTSGHKLPLYLTIFICDHLLLSTGYCIHVHFGFLVIKNENFAQKVNYFVFTVVDIFLLVVTFAP